MFHDQDKKNTVWMLQKDCPLVKLQIQEERSHRGVWPLMKLRGIAKKKEILMRHKVI